MPKHFPAGHIHRDCFFLCFGICSYTWIEIRSAESKHDCCHGRHGDFIHCPKAFPAGQPGFPFTPLQAVSHSLAESVATRAMLETTEICPEGNGRNTGGRTADHCKVVRFLPLTPTLQSYLQDFIQPPRRCKHMFASTYVRKTSRLKSPSRKYVYRHLGLNTN